MIGTGLLRKGKTPAGRSGRPRSCTIDSPPRESVVKTDDERVIYYVVDGDKAVQTPVKTGLRDGNLVEVEAEGLKEGDTIVTAGAYGLPKETKVKIAKH